MSAFLTPVSHTLKGMRTENTETVPIDAVRPHPKNVRQGDIGAISESLKAHGQYRAIVAQRSTGHIIAGNHTWKAAKVLGWNQIAVHWLDVDDEKALRILLVDNRTTDLATYDSAGLADLLKTLSASPTALDGTGFDGDALDELLGDLQRDADDAGENPYTQAARAPIYEIVGEQPATHELCEMSRYAALQKAITAADLPDDVREFLMLAAARHLKFDYQKIAEYYAHLPAETQRLFEDSALVIVDFDKAIELGYVTFRTAIDQMAEQDFYDG